MGDNECTRKMTRILKLSQFSDIDTVHMALDTVL